METELILEEEIIGTQGKYSEFSDKLVRLILFIAASIAVIFIFLIIFFLFLEGGDFFTKVGLDEFLTGKVWLPGSDRFGAAALIVGTLLVTLGAMVIAIPLGVASAIFIAEIAPPKLARYLKLAVELLSGIPSVVYGFFGFIVMNEWIEKLFNLSSGNSWLSGSIILAVMALPIITSVCEDAISSVPQDYKEASLAMGATKWQTISKAIVPAAMSGITAGIILGMGRAIGETIAVVMVTGNNAVIPNPITDIFSGLRTITAAIILDHGEAVGLHLRALFALGILLFMMTLLINTFANIVLGRLRKKFQGKQKKRKFIESFSQKLKKSELFQKIPTFWKHYKKQISYGILIGILIWVFLTWSSLPSFVSELGLISILIFLTSPLIIMISIPIITMRLINTVKEIYVKRERVRWYGILIPGISLVLVTFGIILYNVYRYFEIYIYLFKPLIVPILTPIILITLIYSIRKISVKKQQVLWYGIIIFCIFLVLTALGIILFHIISKGLSVILTRDIRIIVCIAAMVISLGMVLYDIFGRKRLAVYLPPILILIFFLSWSFLTWTTLPSLISNWVILVGIIIYLALPMLIVVIIPLVLVRLFNIAKEISVKKQRTIWYGIMIASITLALIAVSFILYYINIYTYFISPLLIPIFTPLILISIIYSIGKIPVKEQEIYWYGKRIICGVFVLIALGIITLYILSRWLSIFLTKGFLRSMPRGEEGGILPAIIGTFYLIGGAVLFAVPIGILAGIYLSEYSKEGKITKVIRAAIDNLNGTPSIIFGLFGYLLFVLYLDFGVSILSGMLTLGLMILPTIIKTTEEAVKAIPQSFREGSLALGSTKWQSIYKVVLPSAIPGTITGVILGMGRAAGETAPIVYTAGVFTTRFLPTSIMESTMALSFNLFIILIAYWSPEATVTANGLAITLLMVVIFLYGLAFIIRNHYRKKKLW